MHDSLRCVSNILKLNKKNVATISYLQQAPWLFVTTIRQAAPKSQWASFDHRKRCSYGFPAELRLESIVSTSEGNPEVWRMHTSEFRCPLHEASDERDN